MKRLPLIIPLLAAVGFFGLSAEAFAGGNAPPASCQVPQKPSDDNKITGEVAIVTYQGTQLDATLRLDFNGRTDVFRVGISFANVLSPEQVLCDVLAANPLNAAGQDIKTALGIKATKKLVITGPPEHPDTSVKNSSFAQVVAGPSGDDNSGIADVKIFLSNK